MILQLIFTWLSIAFFMGSLTSILHTPTHKTDGVDPVIMHFLLWIFLPLHFPIYLLYSIILWQVKEYFKALKETLIYGR